MNKFDINKIKWVKGWNNLPEAYYPVKIPSVTHIINSLIPDPELDKWIKKVGKEEADKITEAASNRGTSFHIFLENFLTIYSKTKDSSKSLNFTQIESPKLLEKQKIPQNKIDEGRNLFYNFYYSEYVHQFENILALELGIYSKLSLYRGKLDIFYKNRIFGPSISDFKSANSLIKKGSIKEIKFKYQLGAYANALDEMYESKGIKINHASILCINTKKEELQEITCEGKELEKFKNDFKTLCHEFHIINKQQLFN